MFYRQIQVGQVKNYVLAEDDSTVEVQLYIQPEYAHLVRKHTRFWNASGVTVDAGLTGVKFRTESLASSRAIRIKLRVYIAIQAVPSAWSM
ncbi:hypothetical protein OMR07_27685, partial [Methylobacterium organophilum]|nr:hypothetical protein [Methylobacterium organophilum]